MTRSLEEVLDWFQREAARTWASPCPDYLAIAGLGLAGEAAEVASILAARFFGDDLEIDTWNHMLKLELGDLLHYSGAMARYLSTNLSWFAHHRDGGKPLDGLIRGGISLVALDLCTHAGLAADAAKKMRYHGHRVALHPGLDFSLHRVVSICLFLAERHGWSAEEVLAANLSKQRARYPHGFSAEASLARTDEKC